MFVHLEDPAGGVVLEYRNDTKAPRDVDYASATAPSPIYVSVALLTPKGKATEVDGVWVGGGCSHSWWAGAGGKLLRRGLDPDWTLRITATGPVAFRYDWTDE